MMYPEDQHLMKDSDPTTITVFTLNCWGIKYVSHDRISRMRAIATHLSKNTYDFVCLQEVWVEDDFQLIKENVRAVLPYAQYFYSGFTGSGICMFSRWPMREILFHQWQLNGYFHKLLHGDWFGGKGVAVIQCIINECKVNIYSVHLHAEYCMETDEYLSHRIIQAFDLSQFIRLTSQDADLAILAGDLNTLPSQLCYQLVLTNSNMHDASEFCTTKSNNGTFNNIRNSYTNLSQPINQRIDHIFYKSNSKYDVQFVSYSQPLPDRVLGERFSYSDHEAVSATFKLSKNLSPNSDQNVPGENVNQHECLEKAITICESALTKLRKDKIQYYSLASSVFLVLLVIYLTDLPYTYIKVFSILMFFSAILMAFFGIMGFFWVGIENNGILSGYHSMKIAVNRIKK